MTRLLVTGGAGFIGSNFTRRAVGQGHDVVVLDKLTYAGNKENLRDLLDGKKIEFVKGDVCDRDLVDRLVKRADAVVHFAAETHVDRSILEAGDFVQTDVVGTFSVLEACRKAEVDRVLAISTDEVYGEAERDPCREDAPLMPKSPYAASKAGADHGTGKNTRDWIHVDDHCAALEGLLEAKGVAGEVFNIGASEEHSVNEIASAILKTLGKPKSLLKMVPDRPGHVQRHAVDTGKIRSKLRWKPSRSFAGGLQETVQWYRDHETWWRATRSGGFQDYYSAQYRGLEEQRPI